MSPTTSPTNGHAPDRTSVRYVGETADDWYEGSITKGYHRMRAGYAIRYIRRLQEESLLKDDARVELEKLEDEEHRIKESRDRLDTSTGRSGQLKELKALFWKWREEADRCTVKDKKLPPLSSTNRERLVKPTIECRGPPCKGVRTVCENDNPAHDLNVYFMFFEKDGDEWKGKDYHQQRFPKYEHFPNQRISVYDALYDEKHNPFKPIQAGEQYLRYIHIPANHMGWIEQAMARYHDEHKILQPGKRLRTNQTLSREFWKGQLHGSGLGRNPIHATHMRPRCSVIPGETQSLFGEQRRHSTVPEQQGGPQEETKVSHKDLAIFMPYLHWETSSRRARMTRTVEEVLGKTQVLPRTATTILQEIGKTMRTEGCQYGEKDDPNRKPRQALARYLMKLAQVWQDMDMELDERLVKHHLLSRDTEKARATESLLHIRRTLDQSYFLHLKDTSQRDRDQVVYRATKKQGNLARVVMVDQLWLWILDDHTIITSFPKRWGRNKPDSSGIHRSLRDRLGRPDCKIMSARHLACIIIDQCSNVFFDRTKPLDLRPEVMDIFTETIGDVNYRTTMAFKRFWFNVDRFTKSRDHRDSDHIRRSQKYLSRDHRDSDRMRRSQKYLGIDIEGALLREAQDIAEELKIMISIYSKQLGVVKNFHKCLEQMNGNSKTRRKALQLPDPPKDQRSSLQVLAKKPVSASEMDFLEDLIEEVEDRKGEIMDLEKAALQACRQLQELLSLKQQQASIVAAHVALDNAQESIQQGKAIMAFTIMTIIFTPLGFFTSFFGMNHALTGADWMSLGRQCLYMFCISAMIILIALSLAFKSQLRQSIGRCKWSESKPVDHASGKVQSPMPRKANYAGAPVKGDEGKSSENDSAMKCFGLVSRVGRSDRSRHDVENPGQGLTKIANGKH